MYITVVNNHVTHCCPSIEEIAATLRELDPYAASYVEVFENVGNGNDVLNRVSCSEKGKGITPDNLDKYRHRIG